MIFQRVNFTQNAPTNKSVKFGLKHLIAMSAFEKLEGKEIVFVKIGI